MSHSFCQLWLTCEDEKEASKIAKHLLDKRLVVCAKQLPLTADYWWEGTQEHTSETLLIMESSEEMFDKVEVELEKIHSYETFVLQVVPLKRVSKKASEWMKENLDIK